MSESWGEPRAGQEAAKLLAAAQDWLRTSAPHVAPLDAEGRTCACPLCRIVAGVRDADPVALGSWVDAAVAAATTTLAQAAETLAPPAPSEEGSAGDAGSSDDGTPAEETPDVDDVDGLGPDHEGDADATDDAPASDARDDVAPGQDDDRARGVRRIPLVQNERSEQDQPGDLDG